MFNGRNYRVIVRFKPQDAQLDNLAFLQDRLNTL